MRKAAGVLLSAWLVLSLAGCSEQFLPEGNVPEIPGHLTNLIDSIPPLITFRESSPATVNVGDQQRLDQLLNCYAIEGSFDSATLSIASDVDLLIPGVYSITVSACDRSRNCARAQLVVKVVAVIPTVDTVPPVIMLNGSDTMVIHQSEYFKDPWGVVIDNVDGDISDRMGSIGSVSHYLGISRIRYYVTDKAGNRADAVRVVRVVADGVTDWTAPVLSLKGSDTVIITQGDYYYDDGASAIDDADGDISYRISTINNVNTMVAGFYFVYYSVVDQAGNEAKAVRMVKVAARLATPVIIVPVGPHYTTAGSPLGYLGVSAFSRDVYGNKVSDISNAVVQTGTVNTDLPSTYLLWFNVTDENGNAAEAKSLTVVVNPSRVYEAALILRAGDTATLQTYINNIVGKNSACNRTYYTVEHNIDLYTPGVYQITEYAQDKFSYNSEMIGAIRSVMVCVDCVSDYVPAQYFQTVCID